MLIHLHLVSSSKQPETRPRLMQLRAEANVSVGENASRSQASTVPSPHKTSGVMIQRKHQTKLPDVAVARNWLAVHAMGQPR